MLPDHLAARLEVLFCGTAAGRASAAMGHYYAGRGNRFWRVLHEVGLTPELLSPERDSELPGLGVGLTDLAKGVAGMDRDIAPEAFAPDALRALVAAVAPRRIAFNGKKAAEVALGVRSPAYGRHRVEGLPDAWVLPSTSGAAHAFFAIAPWQDLAEDVRAGPARI